MAVSNWRGQLGRRPDPAAFARALLVPLVGLVLGAAALVALSPLRGPLHSPAAVPGPLSLQTAGVDPLFVAASLGMGMTRLYLTALPLALLAVGALVGVIGGGRWSLAVGALCGLSAAGTLTILSGCPCGTGSTTPLWRSAGWMLAEGVALSGFEFFGFAAGGS